MTEKKKTKIYITYAEGWYSPFSWMNYYWYAVDAYDKKDDQLNSLCSHLCSNVWFVQLDMWYIMNDENWIWNHKHEIYQEAHPEWYEVIWFWKCDDDYNFEKLKQMLIDDWQVLND